MLRSQDKPARESQLSKLKLNSEGDINRRGFLNLVSFSIAGILIPSSGIFQSGSNQINGNFPTADRLGRVLGGKVEVKLKPEDESLTVKELFEDSVVVWIKEVIGSRPLWNDQRYVETPEGYIYSANLQPVRNLPNSPLKELPSSTGYWAEVSVPYVDITLANPPGRSPWLKYTANPRLYFSQIMWVDQLRTDENNRTQYRVSDRYGGYGDFFWAAGEAFRILTSDEISPINPENPDKLVVVNLNHQTLSCMEGSEEVYFCRVSTGPNITSKSRPGGEWATPVGKHTIWRKLISVHMTGGTTGGGYDLAGIGWTTLFASKGMAIHSTFWHNSFGIPQSHGCVNCTPEDAKWIFRWTMPEVSSEPGDITLSGMGSTQVLVQE